MIPIQCRFYTASVVSHRTQQATPFSSSQLVSTGTTLPRLRSQVTGVASNRLRQQLRTEINSCNLSLKVVHVMVSHAHTVPRSKGLSSLDLAPGLQESQGFPEPDRPCRNRPPATGYCDVRPCLWKLLEI